MAFSFGTGTGGGFGQQNSMPAAAKPSFSFGTPAAPASTPSAAPTFSFGAPAASSTAPTTSTGAASLFGGQQQQQQQQPAASTISGGSSLFSGFGQQQQQQQQSAGQTAAAPAAGGSTGFSFGGFGAKPAASTPAPAAGGTGLFGSLGASTTGQQQQQSKPTFSFGAPAAGTSANTTSGLSFGASTSQQPSQQQQQQGSQSQGPSGSGSGSNAPITKSTKFEDLPEPARKMIEEIETYIQGRNAIYDSLSSQKLGAEIEETSRMLRSVSLEFSALSNHLNHDAKYTGELRGKFESSLRDAVKAVQIVDSYRAPVAPGQGMGGHPQGAQGNQRPHATFLQEFFRRKAEDLSRRLSMYRDSITQVQASLSRSDPDVVKSLLPTLRAQHSATLQLASRLSQLEQGITELKAEYRDLWRERTGSVRDPFIERRREVLGSEAGVLESVQSMSIR